jgi:hypothetical protein
MDIALIRNVGSLVALVTSILPQASSGGTITGSVIDRAQHNLAGSLILHQIAGAATGAPTAESVQTVLQHSPDNATWTTFATATALAAASTENSLSVDLTGAYRYLRPVAAVTLTGGTSPTLEIAVDVALAGQVQVPAV